MKPRVKTSREVVAHIDPARPVFVYRNLHKKCLSVQQDGIELEWDTVYYNPYRTDEFTEQATKRHVKGAKFVDIEASGSILSLFTEFIN
jgi:hypothetical protein